MDKFGNVTLLGAGCGRGLITEAGLKAMKEADIIVYDDLLDTALLEKRRKGSELLYVGKRSEKHSKKQADITQLLIDHAKQGKRVLRLKGGDSFVFGRGGEEYLALKEAGIPVRVIPGISSGIAVPEKFGIPVTHRGIAQSVTFITGHSASDFKEDYQTLAKLQGTLVFFMGLKAAPEIARQLIACGKDPKTPAAILSKGYRADEKRVDGTLDQMEEMVSRSETPALVVIGQVAAFHMESTFDLPLKGASVTVTGSSAFVGKLAEMLEELGAYVDKCITIEIAPDESVIPDRFEGYDWLVFTSSNGVQVFFEGLMKKDLDLRILMGTKFACIGSGTAKTLKKHGFIADFIPSDYTAQCLGRELGQMLASEDRSKKLLILRAENGSPLLNAELDQAGIAYVDQKIYRSVPLKDEVENQGKSATDYIVFGSSQGAKTYLQDHTLDEKTKVICIGEQTASVFEGKTVLKPQEHTTDQIVKMILEDYGKNS